MPKEVSFEQAETSTKPVPTRKSLAEERVVYSQAATEAGVPLHAIDDATGGLTPRDFNPEDARPVTTSLELSSDERIHLHQVVHEDSLSPFSDDIVEWIVTDLDADAGEVTLKDGPPEWMDERIVEVSEFSGPAYEPQYLFCPERREPRWGW